MKNFESRNYSINDLVEWDKNKQLVLNPYFQRRAVWSDKAKSYLMDTIVRGKPIPKIFIRQKINVSTKTSMREVVDGQQRVRTILSYIKDGFPILEKQNKSVGGKRFSDLDEITQENILGYEISVDLLINMPDSEILDIFGRLNSYAVVLNEQERINATHFSGFKILADTVGRKYFDYWTKQKILTSNQLLRMQEVSLVADILIALIEGIKSKKQVGKFYSQYEEAFAVDVDVLETRFDATMTKLSELFPDGLISTEFNRVHIFYSIFTAVFHCLYGLRGIDTAKALLGTTANVESARNRLDRVTEILGSTEIEQLPQPERQFIEDSRRATTDEAVRIRRTKFLVNLMRG